MFMSKNLEVPEDFDWVAYRSLSKDLNYITNQKDAIKHWKQHGHYQNRKYTFENEVEIEKKTVTLRNDIVSEYQNKVYDMPPDFNWIAYKSLNKDLNGLKTYLDTVKHYKIHGFYQHRPYTFEKKDEPVMVNHENDLSPDQLIDMIEVNYTILNRQNGIPEDFDWHIYKSNNPDLYGIKTYHDAVRHYKEHGYRESRKISDDVVASNKSSVIVDVNNISPVTDVNNISPVTDVNDISTNVDVELPRDFDWNVYRTANQDLQHIKTRHDAIQHYLSHGWREMREYKVDSIPVDDSPRMEKVHVDYDWIDYRHVVPSKEVQKKVIPDIALPHNFDWMSYKLYNPDLTFINSYVDAVKHYREHGYKENREYVSRTIKEPKEVEVHRKYTATPTTIVSKTPTGPAVPKAPGVPKAPAGPCAQGVKKTARGIKKSSYVQPAQNVPFKKIELKLKIKMSGPKIISTTEPSAGSIPNIIHFVYGFKEQSSEFDVTKYIAIMSAYHLNKPDKIYFHYKFSPYGPLWDKVKPYLTLMPTDPPETIFGKKVNRYAHKADIVRLNVLNEMGGIYMDIDTVCLRPINELMKYDFVMGIQGDNYGLCNAIMMSKPNTEFGKSWIKSYESFNGGQWDTHSVKIPQSLSKIYPITIVSNDTFFYPLWDPFPDLVLSDNINYDCCRRIFKNSYCLHLWETWCGIYLRKINEKSLFEYNSLYNIICRKFIRNDVTLILILNDLSDKTVQSIATFYKILNRDDVSEFIIYDNRNEGEKYLKFLDNLVNINPKFKVIHGEAKKDTFQIKRDLCREVKTGIIFCIDGLIHMDGDKIMDIVIDLMYDESIGMLGIVGGNINSVTHSCQMLDKCDIVTTVDYISNVQIFRSEIFYYNVKFDVENPLCDVDFSFQIRNLGKSLLVIPSKDVVTGVELSVNQASRDLWNELLEKWNKLLK
jgi:hypothetical protein